MVDILDGRDGSNKRMRSIRNEFMNAENFKTIDETKLSKKPDYIKSYTNDSTIIVNMITNIPYIASSKAGEVGKPLASINKVGVFTLQNINFGTTDKEMDWEKDMKKRNGVTMVTLIITVIVLGLLSSIAIYTVISENNKVVKNTREVENNLNERNLEERIVSFRNIPIRTRKYINNDRICK